MSDIEPLRAYAVLDGEHLEELWAEIDTLRAENESATKYLRTFSEELVIAGYAGGDRDVTLANLRAIIKDAAVMRELVREALYPAVAGWHPDATGWHKSWVERAEKALGLTASPPL